MLSDAQERDYTYFSENLGEWLKDDLKRNKFAVIQGESIKGLYDSFEAAFQFACTKFAEGDFLIQQIIDSTEIVEFLRVVVG